MRKLTDIQIDEIVQEIECGFSAYINKKKDEIIFLPHEELLQLSDSDEWDEDLSKVNKNKKDYLKIELMSARDSFRVMQDFAGSLENSNRLKDKLVFALSQNHPFRQFNKVIDGANEERLQWFDFRRQKIREWVVESIEQM